MKEEYEFILSIITKENTIDTVWNLLNMISANITSIWLDKTILYPCNFLEYLYEKNKISKILYKKIIYNDEYIKNHSLDVLLKFLYDSLDKTCKKENRCINYFLLNYLIADYIFNNKEEKEYFFSKFLANTIDEIHEDDNLDFFLNTKPYEMDISEVSSIKLYYFIKQYRHERKYNIEEQIQAQKNIDEKSDLLKKNLINSIDLLIEGELDEDSMKETLKNIKNQLDELIIEDNYLL